MSNSTIEKTVGWVPEGGTRSTLALLWSCLFTMFLCTWTALHFNVPGPHDSKWTVFVRKAKWMCIGLLAPEFVTAVALYELDIVTHIKRKVNSNSIRFVRSPVAMLYRTLKVSGD